MPLVSLLYRRKQKKYRMILALLFRLLKMLKGVIVLTEFIRNLLLLRPPYNMCVIINATSPFFFRAEHHISINRIYAICYLRIVQILLKSLS